MKYLAILLVCFSFPAFAAIHAVSRSAKAGYSASKASAHAGKRVVRAAAKPLKFAAKQVF